MDRPYAIAELDDRGNTKLAAQIGLMTALLSLQMKAPEL